MDECADMVKAVKDAKEIAGTIQYGPTEGEQGNLKFRRSLFAVKDIKAGEAITRNNVRSIRPSTGLKPKYMNSILDKKAKVDIAFGTPLNWEVLE